MKIKHAKASYFTKLEMTKTDVLKKMQKRRLQVSKIEVE